MPATADLFAFADEAGEKGYSRNLSSTRDFSLGIMCAIVVPAERVDELRRMFRPDFDRFVAAAPPGAKIHITDAFDPRYRSWAVVAEDVRENYRRIISEREIPIVYDARRLGIQRESHQHVETFLLTAHEQRRSNVRISARPSDDRIEEQLITGLILKLDALAEDSQRNRIDLYLDETDDVLLRGFRGVLERTKSISQSTSQVSGWDPLKKTKVSGQVLITATADFDLDVTRVGEIGVAGKSEPLIFAADVITNDLYHHLCELPTDAPLNAPSSVSSWRMGHRVYGVRDGAVEDRI